MYFNLKKINENFYLRDLNYFAGNLKKAKRILNSLKNLKLRHVLGAFAY